MKCLFSGPVAIVVGGLLSILGLIAFAIRAVQKVQAGHGLDYYFTGWGVQLNYIGVLIVFALIPVALLIGLGIRW